MISFLKVFQKTPILSYKTSPNFMTSGKKTSSNKNLLELFLHFSERLEYMHYGEELEALFFINH